MHCKQELSALPREGPLSGVVETSYVEAPLPDPGGAAGEEEGAGSRELAGDHPSALIVVSSSGGGARAGLRGISVGGLPGGRHRPRRANEETEAREVKGHMPGSLQVSRGWSGNLPGPSSPCTSHPEVPTCRSCYGCCLLFSTFFSSVEGGG